MCQADAARPPQPGFKAPPSAEAGDALRRLSQIADLLEAQTLSQASNDLARRLVEQRFYLACLGQFKRGKSTLLNALVGRDLLPTGVTPVTAVITVIRYAAEPFGQVRYNNGRAARIQLDALADYVSDEGNPRNSKQVLAVEVFVPSPLLASGMCLVDTPGVGSVFHENSAETRAFVPNIDAVLLVVGADPPISADELALLEATAEQSPEIALVLNKADRLDAAARAEAISFTKRVVTAKLGSAKFAGVMQVSAKERIKRQAPTRDWCALENWLTSLAQNSGAHLVAKAKARGIGRICRGLLSQLDLRLDALTVPLELSRQRLIALRKSIDEADVTLRTLHHQLLAEEEHIGHKLDQQRSEFLATRRTDVRRDFREACRSHQIATPRYRLRYDAYAKAQDAARVALDGWRPVIEPLGHALYDEVDQRFQAHASTFVSRVAHDVGFSGDAVPFFVLGDTSGLRAKSQLWYTLILRRTTPSPVRVLADLCLTKDAAGQRIVNDLEAYLDDLLETNSARVVNDLKRRVTEGRQRLEVEVQACLRQGADTAQRAVDDAALQQGAGAPSTANKIAGFKKLRQEVEDIMSQANFPQHSAGMASVNGAGGYQPTPERS